MKKKPPRQKGQIYVSKIFQELKPGNRVTIARELSVKAEFPRRLGGCTGIVQEARGKAYIVKVRENGREKQFIIKPVHLKRI